MRMENSSVCLMNFPDCLLLNILKYLDSTSLYQLTKVNRRLQILILDSCLWKKIDARSEPNSDDKIAYCLRRVNKYTTALCLRGKCATGGLLTEMKLDSYTNHLTILALEDQNINEPIISLNDFPKTLVELSFKNSSISNSSHFFRRTNERMENLRVLLLDGCSLINSSVVMSVSKYQNLEILSFYKCEIENSIPYFSIAAFHGFKKLKVLDVRLSGLGNPFLKSMIRSTNIISFYFQNMDTSYILDYENRQFEMELDGKKALAPQVDFTTLNTIGSEDTLITDTGTAEFLRTAPKSEIFNLPRSFLFTDPYGPCTCGYIDSNQGDNVKESEENESSDTSACHSSGNNTSDRYRVIEYPAVTSNQKESKNEGFKRKNYYSSKRPLKKRKRTADDSEGLPCQASTSSNVTLTMDTADCDDEFPSTTEIHCTLDGNATPTDDPSSSHESRDAERPSKIPERCNSCSISVTETVECLDHDGNARRNDNDQKGMMSLEEDIRDKGKEKSDRDCKDGSDKMSAGCSKNSQDGSGNGDQSDCDDEDWPGNDDKPEDNPRCRNVCCDADVHSSSKDSGNSPTSSSSNFTISASRPSKCSLCGTSLDKDRETAEAGNSGDSDDSDRSQSGTPPPNSQNVYADSQQNQIGVISINRIDANQRNLLQICIRRNRERGGQGSRFNPDVIQMGRDVNYPVVLNFVRMINFMLQPDQQRQNNDNRGGAGNHQEFEVINDNFNANNKPLKLALKRLSFRGYTKVTDLTLRSVEQLNLDLLDVTYTKVTRQGIYAFLRVNPNCRVLHKEFCVCRPRFHF